MLETMILLKINFINDYTNKGFKMDVINSFMDFIADSESDINLYWLAPEFENKEGG